jgi:hypothetical protein
MVVRVRGGELGPFISFVLDQPSAQGLHQWNCSDLKITRCGAAAGINVPMPHSDGREKQVARFPSNLSAAARLMKLGVAPALQDVEECFATVPEQAPY